MTPTMSKARIQTDPESLQTVTRRIRQEHDLVNNLMDRLRSAVAGVPRANIQCWIEEVGSRFDHLRAHLTRHMALEERDGYMTAVVERRPTLSPEVERLNHEHKEIVRLMEGIHDTLESLTPKDKLMVRDCCRRIDDLLHYIEHHENDENLLMTFVFTHDIGTKD